MRWPDFGSAVELGTWMWYGDLLFWGFLCSIPCAIFVAMFLGIREDYRQVNLHRRY